MWGSQTQRTDDTNRYILQALRDPAGVLGLPPQELDLTLRLMRRARLLGRQAFILREQQMLDRVSTVVSDQFHSALAVAESRARVGRWELDRLASALRELPDVPLVVLKGCAYLLAGTRNAAGRSFADVDLLVPEQDLTTVEDALRTRGWQAAELTVYDDRYYRRWTHELPPMTHPERGVEVDLHHNLLMRTARLKPCAGLLFDAARTTVHPRFQVLEPVDLVLHAMVHLFYGGEIDGALRELVDIDGLLRQFAANEPDFWDRFWPRAETMNLARPAFYGLRYAQRILGTPVPESTMAAGQSGGPNVFALWLMDWLVPRALFPGHPDAPSRLNALAKHLLYVRSHWVKMPPLMLMQHLAVKFYMRHIKSPAQLAGT